MYLGLKLIDRLNVLRGWQMRRIVGHLVSYFGVIRPALACFRACYDFYVTDFEAPRKIPDAVKSELAVARGLVFLAVADLAPQTSRRSLSCPAPRRMLRGPCDEHHSRRDQAAHRGP